MTVTKPMSAMMPVLSLLLAATLWGIVWYPLRALEAAGLEGLWTTLIIYLAALALGLPLLARRWTELGRQPLWLLVLAVAAGWCNVAFILAVLEGTVVRVLLLFYLSPIWAVLLARWLLGERLSPQARGVFLLAVSGALIMLWDPAMGLPWPSEPGDWLAVTAGIAFALTNVSVRRLHQVSVPVKTTVSWLGVLAVAVGMLSFRGTLAIPDVAAGVWLGALALGGIGIVIMTLTVQYGVTHMPIHRSAVILLFELIAGAVSAGLLTDEVVRPLEWVGGALIVAAAYWAARLQTHE
ncbi:MAG: DMT family transporter [Gammaproteobacteria bacterium]